MDEKLKLIRTEYRLTQDEWTNVDGTAIPLPQTCLIVKNKDRSLFTLLSIPIGLLIFFWLAAEIACPY